MNILFISHLYPGADNRNRALFNRQLIGGIAGSAHVKVIAPYFWCPFRKQLPAYELINDIEVRHPRIFYVPGLLIHWHWALYRYFVRKYFEVMLAEFKPDHVMLGFLYPDVVAMGQMCRDKGLDYSVRVNGSDFYLRTKQPKFKMMVMREMELAPRVFCPGQALKDAMFKAGVEEGKITAFDNGVDGEIFKYRDKGEATSGFGTADKRRWTQMRDSRIILFVGNLVQVKGPDILINAFASMIETRDKGQETTKGRPARCEASGAKRQTRLVVIGEGKERKRLEKQAERLGIADRVHFLGSRRHEEVSLWMNVADSLCLPSRSEGMPNVVLEALTSGLPVVASDVGECKHILKNEANARVVAENDADGLFNALADMLASAGNREDMARRYKGRYAWSRSAKSILDEIF